jgi:hypothetical protein
MIDGAGMGRLLYGDNKGFMPSVALRFENLRCVCTHSVLHWGGGGI